MNTQKKVIVVFLVIVVIVVSVLATYMVFVRKLYTPHSVTYNLKYCETDDDCLTSCGGEVGRGSCYNKAYVDPDNPPDKTCCLCEICLSCITCECIDNICTAKSAEGNCC